MKRVCIHQPDFAPYLGFFHRLLATDVFVLLDDAQFLRKGSGWHNRDKIKTRQGARWLTLSVEKGHTDQPIHAVRLSTANDGAWIADNLALLTENYRHAPHFAAYFPAVEAIYRAGHERMIDLNVAFLRFFYGVFELEVREVRASSMGIEGRATERLVSMVKALEGTHYLTGTGSRDYLEEDRFRDAGVQVDWQTFEHPTYPQQHGEFVPYLSCLDVVFNCGPTSAAVLRASGPLPPR